VDAAGALTGTGGAARSSSEGVAHGNSTVTVFDYAEGGEGGRPAAANGSRGTGIGNRGGDAESSASARGSGDATVLASAHANGGDGGHYTSGGTGGNARATAFAEGLGSVVATALAEGGRGRSGALGGAAHALATASGAAGSANASATSNGGLVSHALASASAPVASRVASEADTKVGAPGLTIRPAADVQSFAVLDALPDAAAARNAMTSHERVSNAFEASVTNAALALFALGGASADSEDPSSILWSSRVEMSLAIGASSLFDQLVVGLFDPTFSGEGFEALSFRIEREGATIVERSFDDLASALAFFDDGVLELGQWRSGLVGDLELRFLLDLRAGDAGSSFSFAGAVGTSAIPEPSTLALVACGIAVLAGRKRSRPFRRPSDAAGAG
jgi:hypothetical protein